MTTLPIDEEALEKATLEYNRVVADWYSKVSVHDDVTVQQIRRDAILAAITAYRFALPIPEDAEKEAREIVPLVVAAVCDSLYSSKDLEHMWERAAAPITAALSRRQGVPREREIIAEKAREFAAHYTPGSDGRNTFIILAEWIENRNSPTPPDTKGGS